MWWLACCGFILYVLHTIQLAHCNVDSQGGDSCPQGCICHATTYADLPMKKWLHDGTTKIGTHEAPNPHHINEVLYAEEDSIDHDDTNEQLKMAMCIIQKGTDVHTMFASLPEEVQVLTILQSRGSGDIYLEAVHMQSLQLIALDIQGFHQDSHNTTPPLTSSTRNQGNMGQIIIRSDTFQSLSSLQYLNLQYIKILGNPKLGNRPAPVIPLAESKKMFPNGIPLETWPKEELTLQNNQYPNDIPSQLMLLQPVVTSINEEILPYKVYKEEQERAGMSAFSTLNNLLFLRVHACGLKEVNWEMFTGLHKLEYLSLEKNNLLFIPEFTFYGTSNLKTLSLAHNKLLSLQSTGLAGLLDLENLDLSYNNFSHLSELSLPPFPKLQKADFTGNPIQEVFASTFEIMNATKALYLGNKNSEFSIQTNSFLGLDSLVKLDLLNVNIPVMERDLLRGMPQLQQLTIKGSIKSLSFDAFIEMPNLENLAVKSCGIESVSMDAFYGLYGLLYLDLSNNFIKSLPPGVFDQQFSLKELYLESNLLTELPINIFSNIPAKVIRLTDNPWECTCAMRDWKPSIINSRRQQSQEFCQFQYDKGSTCSQLSQQYVYDRSMAPRCTTPAKYKNWSVFTALRKQLHCDSEKHAKFHRKEYLKKKHEEYVKSLNTTFPYYYNKNKNSSLTHKKPQQQTDNEKDKTSILLTDIYENTVLLESNTNNTRSSTENEDFNIQESNIQGQNHIAVHRKHKPSEEASNESVRNYEIYDNPKNGQLAKNITGGDTQNTLSFLGETTVQTTHQNYEQNLFKKKLEKRRRLYDKFAQTKKKEKSKKESTYVVYNNKKPIKVSKKAWKQELEKMRQAILKQASIKKT